MFRVSLHEVQHFRPARHALLLRTSRLAAACTLHPPALRIAPCCSQRVAPCCSQGVALCCPARRALLQPARRALLQPARRALLPCASCPAAASASRPTAASVSRSAAPHIAPCCPAQRTPCCPVHRTPSPLSRRAATTTAATARATAAAGGGAAGSAGSAAGAGGAGGATGSAGGAAGAGRASGSAGGAAGAGENSRVGSSASPPGGGGFGFLRTAQRRQQSQQETFSPQVLSELVPQGCVSGSVKAAALGVSESTATLGASESAAALGARASLATGPSSAKPLHTFTLDSGASRCFFRDCTTLTPLAAPVPVSLADPTGGPVVARASTVLPCPTVPSGSLSGLHLPTFLTNLVSNAAIQDVLVDTFIPRGQRVAICTCSRTGRHLATFTRRPGSSLYTLTATSAKVGEAGQVAASSQVSAPGQLAKSCSSRVLSHQTLLWHHRLSHPSLLRLCGMRSRLLVSGLPKSFPSLSRSPAPPCLPCVKGRQRATPHSSEFPPTTAPLQTLHMNAWGPAPVGGTDQERYFLLVVDDYTCKRQRCFDPPWIRATRRQLQERFSRDFLVLRLHSDKGETSPTLQWTGKVGSASEFRVWGALSLVRDAKASKLSSHTLRCVFLGFPTDAPPKQFYHSHSRRVFSSQDVTFEEFVCYYKLHPHASHLVPLAHLFLVPLPPPVDPFPPQVPAPSDVSQVDPPPLVEPLEPAAVDSGAETAGAEPGSAETGGEGSRGAATGGAGSRGAATGGAGSWCAATGSADSGGPAGAGGAASAGGTRGAAGGGGAGATSTRGATGAGGAGPTSLEGTAGAGGAGGAAGARGTGAGGTGGAEAAGAGGAVRARGATRAAGSGGTGGTAGAGGVGAAGAGGTASAGGAGGATGAAGTRGARGTAGARGAGAGCTGGTRGTGGAGPAEPGGARTRGTRAARARGAASAEGAGGATGATGAGGAGGTTGARGHGAGGAGGTTGARGHGAARASGAAGAGGAGGDAGAAGAGGASAGGAGAAGTALRIPFFYPQSQSSLPPLDSVLRQVLSLPSSTGLPLPLPCTTPDQSQPQLLPGSSLPAPAPHTEVTESLTKRRGPETRASTPVRARRVARPRPPAAPGTHGMALPFALVTELVDFVARSRLDYVASLVTESESVCPPSVGRELALSSDVLEDRQFELECLAAALPRFTSMLVCFKGDPDALDIPTPRSYAEAIVGEYSTQRQTPMDAEMASWKSTGTYLHSLDISTAFLQGSLHEVIWQRRPPGFTGFFSALPSSSPCHNPLPCPPATRSQLHLRTSPLLARYVAPNRHQKVHWDIAKRVLRYLCSTSGIGLVLGGKGLVVLTRHSDACWADDQATQRSSQGYTSSLGSGSVSWRSTRSSFVLSSSCEAEFYAGAMAAQELRWLTYLLTNLEERPRSPLDLYVDNKAMLALCHEQRMEHRVKHIALCYFLARELQQRCQLRLSCMASQANTADVFTKALGSGDHQRFCTALGLVPTLPHLLVA
ncbi:unnamed protein product [Closterium sp. NIES-53]